MPVIVVGGNDLDAAHRPPGVPTIHSAQDINALVRDFTKWDDTPVGLQHFAQSFVRAYKIAMTPPYGPVAISLDAGLQQEPIKNNGEKLYIPRYVATSPPQGDTGAVKEAARLLANAQNPVIVADRAARTENGVRLLVQLAELLQAQVIDQGGRMNFPKTHYLSRPPTAVSNADVILGLELTDFWAVVNAYIDNGEHGIGVNSTRIKPDTKLISINSVELLTKANYQDFQRFQSVDVSDARRRRSDAAGADRGGEVGDPERPQGRDREARRGRQEGVRRGARAHQAGGGAGLGCEPDQHGPPGHGDLCADQGPRLVARCHPPATSATGRTGCGRWRSTTTGSAHRAATASATARRRRSAPRSPTATSAASPSASSPTAT